MRVLVVSDVHSNLPALDAVLADAGSVDAVWQLGDVVGYGPEPNAVIARLREAGADGVRGNHDAAAVGGREIDWFNADARRAMEWTREALDEPARAWLTDLRPIRVIGDVTLCHGSPRDPLWEYVLTADVAAANLDALGTGIGLHGHTHMPIVWWTAEGRVVPVEPVAGRQMRLGEGRVLLNPGSVGQPRDGDPRSSYLILDPDARTATWHRVAYPIETVQSRMRQHGLPKRLVDRLSFGI
jgi:predicted phosphodiesterase